MKEIFRTNNMILIKIRPELLSEKVPLWNWTWLPAKSIFIYFEKGQDLWKVPFCLQHLLLWPLDWIMLSGIFQIGSRPHWMAKREKIMKIVKFEKILWLIGTSERQPQYPNYSLIYLLISGSQESNKMIKYNQV